MWRISRQVCLPKSWTSTSSHTHAFCPRSVFFGSLIALFVFALVSSPNAYGQACPNETDASELSTTLENAEQAFMAMNADGFSTALEDLAVKLPCLRETIQPVLSARYHRVIGIQRYAAGDELGAFEALKASRILDPNYGFDAKMFPPGHQLVVQYQTLPSKDRDSGRVAASRDLLFVFDGVETRKRPAGRAALLQMTTEDGVVRSTAYLGPLDPMPNYEAKTRLRKPLLIGTAILAGMSLISYGGAMASKNAFEKHNPRLSLQELENIKSRTNALVGVSATLGGLAVGGGITVLIVGDR